MSVPDRGTASERPMSGKDRLFQDRKISQCLESKFMFPLQRVHGSTEHFRFKVKKAIGIQGDLSHGKTRRAET